MRKARRRVAASKAATLRYVEPVKPVVRITNGQGLRARRGARRLGLLPVESGDEITVEIAIDPEKASQYAEGTMSMTATVQ